MGVSLCVCVCGSRSVNDARGDRWGGSEMSESSLIETSSMDQGKKADGGRLEVDAT